MRTLDRPLSSRTPRGVPDLHVVKLNHEPLRDEGHLERPELQVDRKVQENENGPDYAGPGLTRWTGLWLRRLTLLRLLRSLCLLLHVYLCKSMRMDGKETG